MIDRWLQGFKRQIVSAMSGFLQGNQGVPPCSLIDLEKFVTDGGRITIQSHSSNFVGVVKSIRL